LISFSRRARAFHGADHEIGRGGSEGLPRRVGLEQAERLGHELPFARDDRHAAALGEILRVKLNPNTNSTRSSITSILS